MRRFAILAAPLLLAACNLDLPGLTALDDDLARTRTVADVHCNADTLAVGAQTACLAYNPDGAAIQSGAVKLVRWATSDAFVVQVDLDGAAHGVAPGVAVITAHGAAGSSASDTVEVVP